MQELITVREAAERLGLSKQRILKLCAEGRIRGAAKLGRDWLIPEGAKIDPPPPRPSLTREIPRAKGSRKPARRAQKL